MQNLFPPRIPDAQPTPQFCADARQVVTNPEQYAGRPLLRRLAWVALLAERGQSANQLQLSRLSAEGRAHA